MNSNMSFLTKYLMFFLVFSIQSNFATSDAVDDCKENVREIFHGYFDESDFLNAMAALSEKLLNLTFIFGDKTFSSRHEEVLEYFEQHNRNKEWKNKSSLAEKQEDIVGYFQSFVATIDKTPPYFKQNWFNQNTRSPQDFCEHRANHGLSGVDIATCYKALCTMLNLRDDDETEMENLMNMTGSKAFIYCYLNYTFLDFTTNNLSSQVGSSSGLLQPFMNLDESSRQLQISVMIKYFSHLLDVSSNFVTYYKRLGIRVFMNVEEYCANAVKIKNQRKIKKQHNRE